MKEYQSLKHGRTVIEGGYSHLQRQEAFRAFETDKRAERIYLRAPRLSDHLRAFGRRTWGKLTGVVRHNRRWDDK